MPVDYPTFAACPFCGENDQPNGLEAIENDSQTAWSIECKECLTQGPIASTEWGAIIAWNTRRPTRDRRITLWTARLRRPSPADSHREL